MLGTGNALATRCYNTCFVLHGCEGAVLVDAGGGNGVLTQLERAGIRRDDIGDLFVTHAHTDHLLGCIWMMRMALQFRYPLRVRICKSNVGSNESGMILFLYCQWLYGKCFCKKS